MGYNRGEWTELYVLMKLLGDKQIDICDSNLRKIEDVYYPIIKIFKDSIDNEELEFIIGDIIKIVLDDEEIQQIEITEFIENANKVLEGIKAYSGKKGAFDIDGIEEIIKKLKIKVKKSSDEKDDFKAQVKDRTRHSEPILTFSIKSKLGAGATILNASSATNIKYKINNLDKKHIETINNISSRQKLKDRYSKIIELGGTIEYEGYTNSIFASNLRYIDGDIPSIVSYLVLYSYKYGTKDVFDLIGYLSKENPLCIDLCKYKNFYRDKIIKVIKSASFGMMPATIWNGNTSVTGGIIVTKKDGEIVLLDKIYYEDELDEYLIKNTKLESPSSSRYHMLELKEEGNNIFFTLNLQIRFK